MSLNGFGFLHPQYQAKPYAGEWRWRLRALEKSLWHNIWWALCKGPTVVVNLPYDKTYESQGIDPLDPYFYYKPWLDKNVGKQGWDWEWIWVDGVYDIIGLSPRSIVIKVRKSKAELISMIALKWGGPEHV